MNYFHEGINRHIQPMIVAHFFVQKYRVVIESKLEYIYHSESILSIHTLMIHNYKQHEMALKIAHK